MYLQTGEIESTRFRTQHQPLIWQNDFINSFQETRQVVGILIFFLLPHPFSEDYFSNKFKKPNQKAFAYSLFYVFFEQYEYIRYSHIFQVSLHWNQRSTVRRPASGLRSDICCCFGREFIIAQYLLFASF